MGPNQTKWSVAWRILLSERAGRFDRSFLAASEQKLVDVILAAPPDSVTPLRLTKIGVIGAVVAAAALVGRRWSPVRNDERDRPSALEAASAGARQSTKTMSDTVSKRIAAAVIWPCAAQLSVAIVYIYNLHT